MRCPYLIVWPRLQPSYCANKNLYCCRYLAISHVSFAKVAVIQRRCIGIIGVSASTKAMQTRTQTSPLLCIYPNGKRHYQTGTSHLSEPDEYLPRYRTRFDEAILAYHRALSIEPTLSFCSEMLTRALEDAGYYAALPAVVPAIPYLSSVKNMPIRAVVNGNEGKDELISLICSLMRYYAI